MPVEYPLRTNSEIEKQIRLICKCGHADFYHDGYSESKSNCSICLCSKYEYEQTLSIGEALDLRIHLMKVADKKGNIQ